jgi:hypothetical protein
VNFRIAQITVNIHLQRNDSDAVQTPTLCDKWIFDLGRLIKVRLACNTPGSYGAIDFSSAMASSLDMPISGLPFRNLKMSLVTA